MKKLTALLGLAVIASPTAFAQDGSSCAAAIPLTAPATVTADTSTGTNWATSYGPLVSPSNDVMYTFTTGDSAPTGSITPTSGFQGFAVYLLSSCAAGTEPTPIGATATAGTPIELGPMNLAPNTQYFVAVTGTAASGANGNGQVVLSTQATLPVTVQSFTVD